MGSIQYFSGSSNWNTSSTSFANYSVITTVSSTITGNSLSLPATKVPGFTIVSGPAGLYQITVNGFITLAGSGLGNEGALRISDGTNVSTAPVSLTGSGTSSYAPDGSLVFSIYESSAVSNLTFQLQGMVGTGTESLTLTTSGTAGTENTVTFDVMYFPAHP
jgi:hypothetical protein